MHVLRVILGTLLIVLLAALTEPTPVGAFREGGLTTWLSAGLLVTCGALSLLTYRTSVRAGLPPVTPRPGHRLWIWIGVGFFYLAADERWRLHESIGKRLAEWMGPGVPIGILARLDDLVLGSIGILALVLAFAGRHELRRTPGVWTALGCALPFLVLSVALDLINHPDFCFYCAQGRCGPLSWWAALEIAEETPKLIAGALLTLGFWRARQAARHSPPAWPAA